MHNQKPNILLIVTDQLHGALCHSMETPMHILLTSTESVTEVLALMHAIALSLCASPPERLFGPESIPMKPMFSLMVATGL